jgi:hypothetical protein
MRPANRRAGFKPDMLGIDPHLPMESSLFA